MEFFKKLFGRRRELTSQNNISQEQYDKDFELKEKGLEYILGKMHSIVGHAIIPFSVGGAVDMYYFTNHIKGTGFATMELLDPHGNGPRPNRLGTYELVAFTKLSYDSGENKQTPFNLIERRLCGIFTTVGNYSFQAILNPNETCEIPDERENKYVVFDNYQPFGKDFRVGERKHHLLLCIEVFKNEMEFARENGTSKLLEELRQRGYYPYSDLDRPSVT
jgi:hypothetical protein